MTHTRPHPCSLARCPVCRATSVRLLKVIEGRVYLRCDACEATFLKPNQRPTLDEERAHYRTHDNRPDDPDYRRFLSKLVQPLLERVRPPLTCLDYGCGPGPALPRMLEEAGHRVTYYDPAFFPNEAVLATTYDVVTCTEVAEHFHRPFDEFRRLDRLMTPGGRLGIMTCFQTDDDRFASWYYRRDPTHVVFYRAATFLSIARARGWSCEIPAKDVVLMRKPD